ncbi:two-component hybrid sensor and regulator [Calothrix sp. NIES-2100]|uniref:ATP-binding sensor histidine kinase n=1 Tax=Calothrix sp. NIES-2100 TaxID=1954172 RepID=UPI000B5FBAE2|nr:two-component hybrid sensor and regulator [Calothrix sp. NIES-2100]
MTPVYISGYHLSEQLYNGSRTLVYQGYRENDALPVVIKLLKNPYPNFSELVQFRNQYTIAKNLNSPVIIQIYGLETYQNGYALVMEDFGGISLKDYFTSGETFNTKSLPDFFQIAITLCNALEILYRECIIHKDIKPSNILINPQTKQIKLIDFSIASLLPRETQTLISPNILEGTLAYISPEQTGRMNRGIDYRTDFYSTGVTFYELLTGELPFPSNDPMELIHCHIAKTATPVHEINPQIPIVLSEIVHKLMAKNAEERYQSTLGLKSDLENCWFQIKETGKIENFPIAQRDVCDRFLIPDQLYGRETEVTTLLQAFARVSLGATEMMLVAGFSGIGKTAVVNEVHKPIVRQKGYFIKGKFDQFHRNIPLSAFVQAFRDLMAQLLTNNDAQMHSWRRNILAAVGDNGQVIIEVIPELERIIGKQPPAPELSATAAQNRFNLLFQKFTQVFTTAEHPLVIFLDDLQWADSASLKLMQLLIADTGHLFIIGAYRDREVHPAHPLMITLNEFAKTLVTINTITLTPLSQVQVNQLVADTLKCSKDLSWNLSQLIFQKTQGNPFFTTQFLKALYQDKLLQFNWELSFWECDITQVTQQAVTDDVVAFMTFQLRRLPPSTQNVLQLAACIGNSFDLATLAIVSEQSEIETAACLWKALQEGLIIPINDVYKFYQQELLVDNQPQITNDTESVKVVYKFLHDRVQQAAYSLIPDDQKTVTHLKIGQLLRQNLSAIEQEEKLFDIVEHLNLGQELITQASEQEALAQLNLQAAGKAVNSTAYAAARVYLQTGIELLQTNCWQTQYELTLNLYIAAAEVAYLNGDIDAMQQMAVIVLQAAKSILDKVKIYAIQIAAQTAQSQMLEAIATARNGLLQLGVELPRESDTSEINKALKVIARQLQDREIADLVDLPVMTNPTSLAAMQLLSKLFSAVFVGMPGLLPFLSAKMVSLSLQFGNAPTSTVGYAIHGLVLCNFVGEVETGYSFGKLALNLVERFNLPEYHSMTLHLFGDFIQHQREALLATTQTLKDSYRIGMETGDFLRAGYSIVGYNSLRFLSGVELDICESELTTYSSALAEIKQFSPQVYLNLTWQTVKNLRETVSQPDCLIGTAYDETVMFSKHHQDYELTAIAMVYIDKLMLAYSWGNYSAAINYIEQVQPYLMAVSGLIYVPIFHFYAALTYLALFPTQPEHQQAEILTLAQTYQTSLHQWAQNAPMNHLHKWYLVEAEKQRVLGEKIAAIECYDKAISLAQDHQFIHEEALANELAAKFYLDWDKKQFAQLYIINAYYCYARWGAKAKVNHLEKSYPQLLQPILLQQRINLNPLETLAVRGVSSSNRTSSSDSTSISEVLDFTSVLKAAIAISSSLELDTLISSLTRIILENSGAKKVVLLLPQDNTWQVRAITWIDEREIQTLLAPQSLDNCADIPNEIIYYVKNTQKTIALNNCQTDIPGLMGKYMLEHQPQSVLCTPIINQGHLLGILYLENQLTNGVFTSDRLSVLKFLCAQAAISLDNSQLYHHLQEREKFLSSIYEGVGCLIFVVDVRDGEQFEYTGWSKSCELAVGIPAAQVLGKTPQELHPKDQGTAVYKNYLRCYQTGIAVTYEECLIFNGEETWWLTTLSPLKDETGKVYRLIGTTINISDRRQAEKAVSEKSQALTTALDDLQQAQLKIVQSEKMSALGNLVAGVAHEMNNPLGFISSSLKQAKPTITDIVTHLQLYQENFPNHSNEIIDHAEEIDLDYILEDIPKVMDAMVMACDRLKNISTSLRTFSRADKDYKVPFNIHEGIDSTILILKHRLKANEQRPAIEVKTEYGKLPQIECFPGQLNQVFMNILANAIDALDETNHGRSFAEIQARPNRITVKTSLAENQVKIIIADNGKGMGEDIITKIFDHLFTTKAVGKGTGLGLAIARQIVEETHAGKLRCNSVLGEGTEFLIELPISGIRLS